MLFLTVLSNDTLKLSWVCTYVVHVCIDEVLTVRWGVFQRMITTTKRGPQEQCIIRIEVVNDGTSPIVYLSLE